MQRVMRSVLVALLVAMLSFSPATACHYCGGYGGGGYYSSGGYYQGGYYESGGCGDGCSGDGYYDSSCCGGEVVVSEGCGDYGGCSECGSEYVEEAAPSDDVHVEMMAPEAPFPNEPMPSTVNRPAQEEAPSLPPGPMPGTPEMESAPLPTYSEPATEPLLTPSVESTPVLPPPTEAASEPAPLPTEPTTPPAEATDDLFGEPLSESATDPVTTPETEPAATSATEPATPPADDMFGESAAEESSLPAEDPATPVEADDFFSEPATDTETDSAPATEPAAEPTGEPSDEDLFAPPAEETPAEEEKPTEETTEDSDLFGAAEAILEMPGGLASSELREWVDNTGNHSCRGRMVRMLDGKVQLLKDNGRTTTVSLARLSKGDLEFVNRQASAQKAESLGKTAQVTTDWSK